MCHFEVMRVPTQTFQNLPETKKNRIFDSIKQEIIRHGVDHFLIAPIIRESEIPRGSFYQYFTDKKDVFDYLIGEIGQKKKMFFSQNQILKLEGHVPFSERLKTTLYWGLEFSTTFPEYQAVWHQLQLTKSPLLMPWIEQSKENAFRMYVEWLRVDMDQGLLNPNLDVEVTASLFVSLTTESLLSDFLNQSIDHDLVLKKINGLLYLVRYGLEKRITENGKDD